MRGKFDRIGRPWYNVPIPRQRGRRREKVVSHSLMKGVMRMGKKFWRQVLRTLICLLAALVLLVYLAPTAC